MDFQSVDTVKYEKLGPEKAVGVKTLTIIDKVDPSKFYKIVVQLGPLKSWGTLTGSKKTIIHPKKNSNDNNERLRVEQVINVYELLPVPGKEVNGLIESTRKWKEKNDARETAGDIRQMLAITSAEVVDHIPSNFALMGGSIPMAFFESYVKEQARSMVAEALANKPGPGRPPKVEQTA